MEIRTQIARVNGMKSDRILNDFGFPLWSILRALLFLLYMNNMSDVLNIALYLDGVVIYTEEAIREEWKKNIVYI